MVVYLHNLLEERKKELDQLVRNNYPNLQMAYTTNKPKHHHQDQLQNLLNKMVLILELYKQ